MLSSVRKCHPLARVERSRISVILASAAFLGGCSADISRFDLGGSPDSPRADYGSSGTTGRVASNEFGSAGYDRAAPRETVARSDLPPRPSAPLTTAAISPEQAPSSSYGNGSYDNGYGNNNGYRAPSYGAEQARAPAYTPPPAQQAQPAYGTQPNNYAARDAGPKGEMIEVRPGDTLYSLSRQHRVSLNDLMTTNGLTSPNLKPGQKLYLPAGRAASEGHASQTARPPRENYDTAAAPVAPAADAPADWTRSYTVRPGDSLYAIARQNGVKLTDLERYNGIADSRKVKPGTTLKLPGSGGSVAEAQPVAPAQPSRDPAPLTPSPTPGTVKLGEVTNGAAQQGSSTPQQPTILNGASGNGSGASGDRVARADTPGSATDAVSPSASSQGGSVAGSRLRWPVAGKVVAGFGPRADGTHNDGVNLAVPMGTDIHAAEGGVVAYAGDELKGYGNLVLVRHDNGWVTAYAHADELLVKRGDVIKRGQIIAKAGRTGQVDQPQVHFELRQGQKPVDPTPFMERL